MAEGEEALRERLVRVTHRWERISAEKDVEIAELKKRVVFAETECDRLRAAAADHAMSENYTLEGQAVLIAERGKSERARALISWIDGMCVDEAPHMEIRAAINRYWEGQRG